MLLPITSLSAMAGGCSATLLARERWRVRWAVQLPSFLTGAHDAVCVWRLLQAELSAPGSVPCRLAIRLAPADVCGPLFLLYRGK